MRVAVLSDVHGNLPALEAVLAEVDTAGVDAVVCGGDVVGGAFSVEVLDLRSLAPMDDEAIVATVRKTNRVLVAHEDTRTGGVAGEVIARINELCFEWLDAPVRRVCAHDVPLPYAPTLEDYVLPQTSDLVAASRWLAAY